MRTTDSGFGFTLLLAGLLVIGVSSCAEDGSNAGDEHARALAAGAGADAHDHDHGAEDEAAHDQDHGAEDEAADGHDHGAEDAAAHDHDHGAESGAAHDHDHPGSDVVVLDPMAARNLGIRTQMVHPETYYDQVKIPGMITLDPDREYEVSAPATVRVLELDTRVPATVLPGERLAVLELVDGEIRALQMDAVALRAEQRSDQTERDRLTRYLESLRSAAQPSASEIERVSADLEVIEARLAAQASTLDALLASLRTAGLSEQQLSALADEGRVATRIEVRVPQMPGIGSFEVIDRPVHRGQTVPAGGTLFELVCLEQLWVMGEAFEADLEVVEQAAREKLPVTVLLPAQDRHVSDLRILALEGEQDGENRVTHFFLELPNELVDRRTRDGHRYLQWAFRAGARVQIMVATERAGERYVIPAGALVRQAGQAWVFLYEQGEHLRIPVVAESAGPRQVVLAPDCGLHPGDVLVTSGALQLNLILQQGQGPEAVDPHAGHSH